MKNGDTMEITKLDRTPDGIYGASIEDEGRSYVVAGKPGREITHALLIKEPGREWVIVRPRPSKRRSGIGRRKTERRRSLLSGAATSPGGCPLARAWRSHELGW